MVLPRLPAHVLPCLPACLLVGSHQFMSTAQARLVWSLEAHEDAITCLTVVGEPRGILSGGLWQWAG